MLSSHQFRHLSAKVLLDAEPGNFETVRQLLGHKSRRQTVKHISASVLGVRHDITNISWNRRSRPKSRRVGRRVCILTITLSQRYSYAARKKLYLPYAAWPEKDRTRWEAAFKAGMICLTTADLQPISRNGRACSYSTATENLSLFSWFVTLACSPVLPPPSASTAKSSKIMSNWQPATCGGITLAIYLYHLWLALRYICPREDWSLAADHQEANSSAGETKAGETSPDADKQRIRYTPGMKLMDRSSPGQPADDQAVQTAFRDGLIIALLALIPLRRRTLAHCVSGNIS